MTIYLYVKTHRKTGLKYLGKTIKDPFKYKGSGVYWTNHLRQHGNDVETQILCECSTNDEVKHWGSYYSKLWNVVESSEWANLMEEKGDGVSQEQAKTFWSDEQRRKAHSQTITQHWQDASKRIEHSQFMKRYHEQEDNKANRIKHSTGKNNPRFDNTIYHFVHNDGREEFSTRYEFYTKHNLNKGTVCELIKGTALSVKGWRLSPQP